MMNNFQTKAQKILDPLGVTINGIEPWDIQIHEPRFYRRVLQHGSLGLGESYMDGWWDVAKLDEFFFRLLRGELKRSAIFDRLLLLKSRLINLQRKSKAFDIGEHHYDIGNDLYKAMLDDRLTYTCGYWKDAKDLNSAQEAKLELVCRKMNLQPGQKILDIGCGWGSFLKYAAEKYGVSGVGITVAKEQIELGRKLCAGLPIELRLQDYRDLNEQFDHIVSLGMIEHVGYKNYRTYMQMAHRCLKDDGLFLLHTIGSSTTGYTTDPWIDKYIFPGGMLPSIAQIGESIEGLFVMEDWHNFSAYYDLTLMAWFENFEKGWPELQKQYGDRFYRMWKYYLLSCAGSFRARYNQLWQIVLSKKGVLGGYQSVR